MKEKSQTEEDMRSKRQSYWYFGGFAASGAVCFTHPLELFKVSVYAIILTTNFRIKHVLIN